MFAEAGLYLALPHMHERCFFLSELLGAHLLRQVNEARGTVA